MSHSRYIEIYNMYLDSLNCYSVKCRNEAMFCLNVAYKIEKTEVIKFFKIKDTRQE